YRGRLALARVDGAGRHFPVEVARDVAVLADEHDRVGVEEREDADAAAALHDAVDRRSTVRQLDLILAHAYPAVLVDGLAGQGALCRAGSVECRPMPGVPIGAAEAPPVVWPEHGKPIGELIATMKATRERSRQSIERLATLDPQRLTFKHFRLGELDLAQWWMLQANHDGIHLAQIRDVKHAP